jgi:hypothetical protein
MREPGQSFFSVGPVLRRQQDEITIMVRITILAWIGLRWAQLGIHWATRTIAPQPVWILNTAIAM